MGKIEVAIRDTRGRQRRNDLGLEFDYQCFPSSFFLQAHLCSLPSLLASGVGHSNTGPVDVRFCCCCFDDFEVEGGGCSLFCIAFGDGSSATFRFLLGHMIGGSNSGFASLFSF
jgi:hypothetical protein